MNALSWMILLGELSASISSGAWILCFIFAAIVLFRGFEEDFDQDWRRKGKKVFRVIVALFIVAAVLPGKNAILAIAASEFGEEALKTETASKAAQALNAWLDKQINPEK